MLGEEGTFGELLLGGEMEEEKALGGGGEWRTGGGDCWPVDGGGGEQIEGHDPHSLIQSKPVAGALICMDGSSPAFDDANKMAIAHENTNQMVVVFLLERMIEAIFGANFRLQYQHLSL